MADPIGIGITTYERPWRLELALPGVVEHLLPVVDRIYIYDDGSEADYTEVLAPYVGIDKIVYHRGEENSGVAVAKNWLLRAMMADRMRYLFLMEDDQVILSPRAIGCYVDAYRSFKRCHHLMFAHHGPANRGVKVQRINPRIELYPNCVGSWCFYTKDVIKEVGYLDENFHNAFEHVEHTHRIQKAGMLGITPEAWGHFPDAVGSKQYIAEQPGSLEDSVIRQDEEWMKSMLTALRYWKDKDPSKFPLDYLIERWSSHV